MRRLAVPAFARTRPRLFLRCTWLLALYPMSLARTGEDVVAVERQVLVPPDAGLGAKVGLSTALDGNQLVVGAPQKLPNGAVDLFERVAGSWTWTTRLEPIDPGPLGLFGRAVAVEDDTLVVSAVRGQSVEVYERSPAGWSLSATLAPAGIPPMSGVGTAIALEGNTLVVGSQFVAGEEGAAHVFVRTGATWNEQQRLLPSPVGAFTGFGDALAIQGDTIVVGASLGGTGSFPAAHVFTRIGSTWTQTAVLASPMGDQNSSFGASVALDGDTIVVGAPFDPIVANNGGAAYVFVRQPSSLNWTLQAFLFVNEPADGRLLGWEVAICGDRVVLSAPQTIGTNPGTGEAYVFVREGAFWRQSARLAALGAPPSAGFGRSIALNEAEVLVGMPDDQSGSVVTFELERAASIYCSGKRSSLGCVPFLATAASASASSANPFPIAMHDALPGEAGVLFYGFASSQLGFHGGTLCVKAPLVRWLPAVSAKASGSPPCAGVLERDFNVRIQSGIDPRLTGGQRVYAQWLQRDPSDPAGFGDSLSDAVTFLIGS